MARILIVDDDQDIRNICIALLSEMGHETHAVDGAIKAIEFLSQFDVDLLITDANMPQHNGFDLVKTIRVNSRWANMTIAMLTGRREKKDIQRAVIAGVQDYILKPIDPLLFLKKVDDLLSRKPSKDNSEIRFAAIKVATRATAISEIELISVSEVGIVFQSPHQFLEGSRIELQSELFEKIGILPPLMRIQSCIQKVDCWESRVTFVGASEAILAKVRKFVHQNTQRPQRAI